MVPVLVGFVHLEHDSPNTEEINGLRAEIFCEDLWSNKTWGSTLLGDLGGLEGTGQAKIYNFELVVLVEHYVAKF